MPSLRDEPVSGTDHTGERHLSEAEYIDELGALICELESAKCGSKALDVRIHYGFRMSDDKGEDVASLLIREGVSWPTVQAALDEIVPPYSTSLDAALEGEEIVFSVRSSRDHRWGAMQRTASGGEELAWAATEPLARRLAALRSLRANLQKSLEDSREQPDDAATGAIEAGGPTTPAPEEPPAAGDATNALDELPPADDETIAARHEDEPERVERENADSRDQKEKDWEILF